jgi:radical SAM superfamily enzyme YgiQ (UPF0313 family)
MPALTNLMNKIPKNLYFYSPSEPAVYRLYCDPMEKASIFVHLNTTPIYLQSYLQRHANHLTSDITWKKVQLLKKTQEELIEEIEKLQIDVLCVSLYVWNKVDTLATIKNIKEKIERPLVIVTGGPSSDPHSNKNFMVDNPDVDFATYGSGESAFIDILEKIINDKKLNVLETSNLAWKDSNQNIKLASFKLVKDKFTSPYLECQELLSQIVQDPEYKDYEFLFPYESSRGCPYACTFCDWTSGLTHKVYHRSFSIEDEIDLLGRLNLKNLYLSDANFGQHEQDLTIAETIARLNREKKYGFKIHGENFSKLSKKRVFEILDIFLREDIIDEPKFAIQDTNEIVLKNIDRPDVPWPEHRGLIENCMSKFPSKFPVIELIQGLPGQTIDTWEQTLIDTKAFGRKIHHWVILPNSPAGYDKEYREKMRLETKEINIPGIMHKVQGRLNPTEYVASSYSYNFDDYIYFTMLGQLLMDPHHPLTKLPDYRDLFQKIRDSRYLRDTIQTLKILMLDKDLSYAEFQSCFLNEITAFRQKLILEYKDWPREFLQEVVNTLYKKQSINNSIPLRNKLT